jgi:hypothetical protein
MDLVLKLLTLFSIGLEVCRDLFVVFDPLLRQSYIYLRWYIN